MAQAHPDDAARRRKAFRRRIAVINQKGGSTKTSTAVNLAAALVRKGYRVRLHDLDPQKGAATVWLQPLDDVGQGAYEVFTEARSVDEATSRTYVPGLFIVPSWQPLRKVETDKVAGAEMAYKLAVDESKADIDYEIFDCTHSLSTLAIAGLAAATELIIPVQASGLDTAGMEELLAMYAKVRKFYVPNLEISGVIVGRTKNTAFDRKLLAGFRSDYPKAVVAEVADSVRMREAPEVHETIFDFEPDGRAARDFTALATVVDEWELAA